VKRATIAVLLAALAVAFTAGPAFADDQSVYDAFVSQDAKLDRFGKEFRRGLKVWKRSHYRRDARVLAALDKVLPALAQVERSVAGETASSDHGRAARTAALDDLRNLRRATLLLRKGIVALTHHHPRRALRHSKAARRAVRLATAAEKRWRREFKAAGITVAPGAGP
jgi:hypothetical protein